MYYIVKTNKKETFVSNSLKKSVALCLCLLGREKEVTTSSYKFTVFVRELRKEMQRTMQPVVLKKTENSEESAQYTRCTIEETDVDVPDKILDFEYNITF